MTDTNQKPRILAVVGATASGKSSLALSLARRLDGEIVSCDSMQIYRRMDVGTAKPTEEERREIRHHLIDIAEPEENYSCADYVRDAKAAISDVLSRGKLPILCGGTGLYLDSLLRGNDFDATAGDGEVRERLTREASELGNRAMYLRLCEIDPESAAATHENNLKRVLRALEIYEVTGKTKSQADRESREAESPYDALVLGIRYSDRGTLYGRIARRVGAMMEDGLLEETRSLRSAGVFETNRTAAQAIGYKELFPYLDGEEPLSASVDRLILATRHYAKRQMTWFGAKPYVEWLEAGSGEDGSGLLDAALERVNRFL